MMNPDDAVGRPPFIDASVSECKDSLASVVLGWQWTRGDTASHNLVHLSHTSAIHSPHSSIGCAACLAVCFSWATPTNHSCPVKENGCPPRKPGSFLVVF